MPMTPRRTSSARYGILAAPVLLLPLLVSPTTPAAAAQDTKPAVSAPAPKDPKLREELLKRVKVDQDVRAEAMKNLTTETGIADRKIIDRMIKVDADNTKWLKGAVKKHGWPGKSLVGEDGAHSAWLLIQHADHDRAFQKEVLPLIEAAVKQGEAKGSELAYLTDRVLVGEGKKQRYGTQFGANASGEQALRPLEDPVNIEELRKSVGLQPLMEYVEGFAKFTGAKMAPTLTLDEVLLFNGRDWTGWTHHLADPNAKREDVWSIDPAQKTITCKGSPAGYIRTTGEYRNYILRLEWRFSPGKAGNSGVLLRVNGPDKVWPRSIEAQLQSGAAGDFWLIDEMRLDTPAERVDKETPRHRLRTKTNEKPPGEWNQYEIIVNGGKVTLKVNGETLNEGVNAEEIAGPIALQSEGAEIHFRNIRLTPLEDKP